MSLGLRRPARPSPPTPARSVPHPLAAPLRLALVCRGVIVLAAAGTAVVYGMLEDDWSRFGAVYVAADFLLTVVACFDALRAGLYALGIHVAISIAWLTFAAYLAPWAAERIMTLA
ncbi:hypothetical protein [Caulobacter sp. 17J80-11]|uniref:hypothetical protein n=1 Tax=Caulobacter sp. 17J80-11 TaxID=2763502 RepID=UPI00165361F6|nr:hypothetical protein [Caulobacter sp. 17J80-11]MBC6982285.1 hypothetical protein [Caulobacter sp. 17J80-11]